MSRPFITSVLIVLTFVALAGQQAPVFRAGVDLVTVGVPGTDRKGALTGTLVRDDFQIYEDGKKQTISYFAAGDAGDAGPPMHLGLLLAVSGSMGDDLSFSKTAAIKFLNTLTDAVDITILDFDTEVRAARYSQHEFVRLIERIRQKKASGFTALYDAIGVYLDGAGGQDGRKIMLLYTDGGDTSSSMSFRDLVDLLKASDATHAAGSVSFAIIALQVDDDRAGLALSCAATPRGLAIALEYDPARYTAGAIAIIADQLATLLDRARPHAAIRDLDLLGDDERRALVTVFNRTERPPLTREARCLHHRFERHHDQRSRHDRQHGDAIVECQQQFQRADYRELRRPERLAECESGRRRESHPAQWRTASIHRRFGHAEPQHHRRRGRRGNSDGSLGCLEQLNFVDYAVDDSHHQRRDQRQRPVGF